ncbi:hypothetical protein DAMA08_018510 [Martiniozyma asiatica (nom. inval.)]|nr:hypothetical protein DAMA08_018510 [Martiniozyma asiatica]
MPASQIKKEIQADEADINSTRPFLKDANQVNIKIEPTVKSQKAHHEKLKATNLSQFLVNVPDNFNFGRTNGISQSKLKNKVKKCRNKNENKLKGKGKELPKTADSLFSNNVIGATSSKSKRPKSHSVQSVTKSVENSFYKEQKVSSGVSTPFTFGAETAGTHMSNAEQIQDFATSKEMTGIDVGNISSFNYAGFDSSPCVNRKKKIELQLEFSAAQEELKLGLESKSSAPISVSAALHKLKRTNNVLIPTTDQIENVTGNTVMATIGSDDYLDANRDFEHTKPMTPPDKYVKCNLPIFEKLSSDEEEEKNEGKAIDVTKYNVHEKMSAIKNGFSSYNKLKFEEWCEKSSEFMKEYEMLHHKVLMARKKFDTRFQYLISNLDDFALQLEQCGVEIKKRSEILKEYCSKIVKEIE